jgi:hypothetical protein
MTRSHVWPYGILPASDPSLFKYFGLTLQVIPRDWNLTVVNGYLDCIPIGSLLGKFIVAIRARLGLELKDCPVVLLHPRSAESLTITDRIGDFLPALLFEYLHDAPGERWDAVREAPEDQWVELTEVHSALGGDDRHMEKFRALLAREDVRDAMVDAMRPGNDIGLLKTWLRHLMEGRPAGAYYAYLEIVRNYDPRPDPDDEVMGVWANAAWTLHTYNHMLNFPDRVISEERWLKALVRAVRRPAGQEGPTQGPGSISIWQFHESNGMGPTWYVAERLQRYPELAEGQPLVEASLAMLGDGPGKYAGMAHASAAESLHEAGRTDEAISAMLSSAFFQTIRFKGLPAPMVGAFRALVNEVGAESHIEVIERHWSRTDPDKI